MFWVKKIVSQLFMPIPLTILLMLLAVALWRFSSLKLKSLAWLCFCGAMILLGGLSQTNISYFLADSLESQYPINSQAFTPHSACWVMVLGSGHSDKADLTAVQQLSSVALGRLMEGIRQLSLGKDCQLVVSGWNGGFMQSAHANVMKQAAIELGINPNKITTFPDAKDTIEEAIFLYSLVGQQPFRLVTSATHMPRSMMIFNSLGMQAEAAPGNFIANKGLWWRLDADNLLNSQKSIHEYLGMLWIQIKGVSADQMVNQVVMPKADINE
ncbi:YdcF family protein [Shewanella holmiensis]|uniref:YdcF family protein n=1 Tax=Shewanella holmiensis TaxID=2952222 RepID=A0A9X3ATK8_9GAMM|nr:ElyC/SanA/YdcF family protein [Shewanella holmiensis]MCT7940324.1 YdcF family protein [Shewanella holmiensis]